MPEMSKAFTPKHMGDPNPNPKLLKLVRKITDRIDGKLKGVTTNDPEYWGYACIFEDELDKDMSEATLDLLLKMKVRQHYPYNELLKKSKMDQAKFDAVMDKCTYFGLLEYDYGDRYTKDGPIPGTTYNKEDRNYWIPLFVPGSAEYTNMNTKLMDKHPELAMFFERMTFLPLEKVTAMVPPGGAGIGMHVIPVEKAIELENTSIDIEHISYWLKRYEGHIGASICSCRYGRKKLNEGCVDDYHDWCIGVGDMADYCRETGRGHDVTYEEAMAILKRAEDNGFVHQITNIDGEGKIFAICNCDIKICNALRTSQLFNTPNMSRSAYVAKVEKDKCVACGRCVEYCPAGAVKLGQKICTKHGEVTYPQHELPDDTKWGPEKWDEDYRDKNRINCYDTGTSPCKSACPAHIAVQGYLKKASQGKYQEALALIKRENPFPAVCGRICNKRCEDACTRGTIDRAVSIDAVKKFIADQDLKAETRYVPDIVVASNLGRWKEKVAIIGGGPAGLSCAFYLAEAGYYPTVFEKEEKPGGALMYGIPSYKLGKDVIEAEIDVMKEMGVEIKTGVEVGKDITLDELRKQGYKAFYLSIGCSVGRFPGVPNDHADGCMTALSYLHDANCGGAPFKGNVVVIGGGNVAIDSARVSVRNGAKFVSMYCLEDADHMPASKKEIADAKEDKVFVNPGWGPKEVLVDEKGKVKGIVFKKCLSTLDENRKFNPKYDENETLEIECDRIIFAVGQAPAWGDMLKGSKVEFFRGVYPVADKLTYQTAEPDIFVGGDVFTGPKFAIDAIAAGKQGAESINRFVQNGSMTIGRNRRDFIALDTSEVAPVGYDDAGRQEAEDKVGMKDPFEDYHGTLTEEQVKKETARCLGCGASVVDPNKCIGCGICTTKCGFDAIKLHRVHPEASTMWKAEDKFKAILPYLIQRQKKINIKNKAVKKAAKAAAKAAAANGGTEAQKEASK